MSTRMNPYPDSEREVIRDMSINLDADGKRLLKTGLGILGAIGFAAAAIGQFADLKMNDEEQLKELLERTPAAEAACFVDYIPVTGATDIADLYFDGGSVIRAAGGQINDVATNDLDPRQSFAICRTDGDNDVHSVGSVPTELIVSRADFGAIGGFTDVN